MASLTMKEGCYYKRRDGFIVGPSEQTGNWDHFGWHASGWSYNERGQFCAAEHRFDLMTQVDEPTSRPVTVTTEWDGYSIRETLWRDCDNERSQLDRNRNGRRTA